MDDLTYWIDEAERQKERANLEESKKGNWIGCTFFLGIFAFLTVWSWTESLTAQRPAQWDVNYEKPVVTLVSFPHWWSGWADAELTDYAWGTSDTGEEGWLPVNKYGHTSKFADEILRDHSP